MRTNILLSFFLLIFFILVDQFSKYLIRLNGGFSICNKGIAFGLQIPAWFFLLFLLSLLILLNFKNWKFSHWNLLRNWKLAISNFKFSKIAMILVMSGAFSNILDRLLSGCVIDFIDLKVWPVFNLADSFIVIGAIMLIINNLKKKHVS